MQVLVSASRAPFFQIRDKIVGVHLDRTKGMGGGGSLRSYFMFP